MARRARAATIALILLGLLVVNGWFLSHFVAFEPMEDMRRRADALGLPADFVLVSESYSPGALGIAGAAPHLRRVYHAPWPGACEALRAVEQRAGPPIGIGAVPYDYVDRMCNFGCWYPAGWRGRIRNFHNYDLRLYARAPGFASEAFALSMGLIVLYPRTDSLPYPRILIPAGRARIDVEMIGHAGR